MKPCLECGIPCRGPRCPAHTAQWQRAKDARRPERRSYRAIQENAAIVAEANGWCPGIPGQVDPHPSADMTADHIPAVAHGGDEHGLRIARCRSCNSKLGAIIRRNP